VRTDEPLSTDKIVAHLTWVLDAYLLDVVDVFKLLSLFIMSALPIMGDMQKQLQRIENYILSSMAWHEVCEHSAVASVLVSCNYKH
jgi:hypothetical protein